MISPEPDIVVERLEATDSFLVLACDGIWNSMTSSEVITFIRERMEKGLSIEQICKDLCDACMSPSLGGDGTGCDNETVIIIDLCGYWNRHSVPTISVPENATAGSTAITLRE